MHARKGCVQTIQGAQLFWVSKFKEWRLDELKAYVFAKKHFFAYLPKSELTTENASYRGTSQALCTAVHTQLLLPIDVAVRLSVCQPFLLLSSLPFREKANSGLQKMAADPKNNSCSLFCQCCSLQMTGRKPAKLFKKVHAYSIRGRSCLRGD